VTVAAVVNFKIMWEVALALCMVHTGSSSSPLQSLLWFGGRRLVLSSDDVPLSMVQQSRLSISTLKTQPKYYLFTDAFVMVQVYTNVMVIQCDLLKLVH
jgi:hypothetical protein